MLIHISNSKRESIMEEEKNSESYMLYHGYGIKNVQNITKKLNGSYSIEEKANTYDVVIFLPNLD